MDLASYYSYVCQYSHLERRQYCHAFPLNSLLVFRWILLRQLHRLDLRRRHRQLRLHYLNWSCSDAGKGILP